MKAQRLFIKWKKIKGAFVEENNQEILQIARVGLLGYFSRSLYFKRIGDTEKWTERTDPCSDFLM